jgi:chromosome segregation ATPase
MRTADPSPDAPRAEPDLGHRAESMASSLGKNKATMRESVMGGEATTGQPESGKSLLSHIASELQLQLDASARAKARGGAADKCADHVRRVRQGLKDVERARSELNDLREATDEEAATLHDWSRKLTRLNKELEQHPDDADLRSERDEAAERVQHYQGAVDFGNREVADSQDALTTAQERLRARLAALKRCREHDHYEHHCGERGGPGVRRPGGGKCMSWHEIEAEAGIE